MKSILIIGQSGQVSTYLQQALQGSGYQVLVADRTQIDLSRLEEIRPALESLNPDLVINPAAYTAVDLAEQEAASAFLVNRDAVAELANYCSDAHTPLIHFSTDYVFDGQARRAYTELDEAAPTGVYGQSKYEGEQAVLDSGAAALILRTSWVYSNHGKNFYKTMLALAASRTELSVVADQVGAPTYAGSIAQACKELVDIIFNQGGIKSSQTGIYHFTCGGQTSWCEFAELIFSLNKLSNIVVHPITTAEYPTPAVRPAFSVLDTTKLATEFGVSLPHWRDALARCVADTQALSSD